MSTKDKKFVVISAGAEPKIEVIDFCSFEETRERIGGFIELVRTPNMLFAVDEEGLMKEGLGVNYFATRAYIEMGAQTPICGTVLVVDRKLDGPDIGGLTKEDAELLATSIAGWYLEAKDSLTEFEKEMNSEK